MFASISVKVLFVSYFVSRPFFCQNKWVLTKAWLKSITFPYFIDLQQNWPPLKGSKFQDEFMKSFFLPKYEPNIVRISALYCAKLQSRNPYNFWFIFWEKWQLHKFILKFTDLYILGQKRKIAFYKFGSSSSFIHSYYFLASLNFPTLTFKREGAKEASFLEVKLFTRRRISKWVRNSMYLAWLFQ